jgi:hypothetical protein
VTSSIVLQQRAAIKHVVAVAAADLGWIPWYRHAGRELGAERDQSRLPAPPVHGHRVERRRAAVVPDRLAEQTRTHENGTHLAILAWTDTGIDKIAGRVGATFPMRADTPVMRASRCTERDGLR